MIGVFRWSAFPPSVEFKNDCFKTIAFGKVKPSRRFNERQSDFKQTFAQSNSQDFEISVTQKKN